MFVHNEALNGRLRHYGGRSLAELGGNVLQDVIFEQSRRELQGVFVQRRTCASHSYILHNDIVAFLKLLDRVANSWV